MIVRALATWRLTQAVTDDEITRPAREGVTRRWPGSRVAYLVTCRRCVSVWAGLVCAVLPRRICAALAYSAVTILLNDALDQQARAALRARMADATMGREESRTG